MTETTPIETTQEANRAMTKVGKLRARLDTLEAGRDTEMQKIANAHNPKIEKAKAELAAAEAGLEQWATENRDTICPEGTKTAKLRAGEIEFRKGALTVQVDGDRLDSIIKTLRERRLNQCVITKSSVDKTALKKVTDKAQGIEGLAFIQKETVNIRPVTGDTPTTGGGDD